MKTCCDGCNEEKATRGFCFIMTWLKLCQECYRKMQRAGQAPKSFNWDGTRVSP